MQTLRLRDYSTKMLSTSEERLKTSVSQMCLLCAIPTKII